jgi:uncharacterized protein YggE
MNDFLNNLQMTRLIKAATLVCVMLFLFLLVITLSAWKSYGLSSPAYNTIEVSGYGETFAVPDIATFSFSVSQDANQVSDAQGQVTKKTDAILAAIKGLGVEEKDVQTSDYSVYPKYKYVSQICPAGAVCPGGGNQVPDGYTVSNTLTVKVRDTAKAGQALAVAGQNGASNISGLSFTVDDPSSTEAEARTKAITDARKKADTLAKSLGVRLGRVVSFTDSSGGEVRPFYATADMAVGSSKSLPPTIQTGQNKITENVTVTYEIR